MGGSSVGVKGEKRCEGSQTASFGVKEWLESWLLQLFFLADKFLVECQS